MEGSPSSFNKNYEQEAEKLKYAVRKEVQEANLIRDAIQSLQRSLEVEKQRRERAETQIHSVSEQLNQLKQKARLYRDEIRKERLIRKQMNPSEEIADESDEDEGSSDEDDSSKGANTPRIEEELAPSNQPNANVNSSLQTSSSSGTSATLSPLNPSGFVWRSSNNADADYDTLVNELRGEVPTVVLGRQKKLPVGTGRRGAGRNSNQPSGSAPVLRFRPFSAKDQEKHQEIVKEWEKREVKRKNATPAETKRPSVPHGKTSKSSHSSSKSRQHGSSGSNSNSSSSSSSSSSGSSAKRNPKDILQLMLAAEKQFIENMTWTIEHFLNPLISKQNSITSATDIRIIFSNFPLIEKLHISIQSLLQDSLNSTSNICKLVERLSNSNSYVIWNEYIVDRSQSRMRLCEWKDIDVLRKYLEDLCENGYMELGALLEYPVQHLSSYPARFIELAESLDVESKEYYGLVNEAIGIRELLISNGEKIQQTKCTLSNRGRLVELQNRVKWNISDGMKFVGDARRRLVRLGAFDKRVKAKSAQSTVWLRRYEVVLFNDCVVVLYAVPPDDQTSQSSQSQPPTQAQSIGYLLFHSFFPLQCLVVYDIPDDRRSGRKNAIELVRLDKQLSTTITCFSPEEKEEWMNLLHSSLLSLEIDPVSLNPLMR